MNLNLQDLSKKLQILFRDLGKIVKEEYYNSNKEVFFKRDRNDLLTKTDVEVNNKIIDFLQKNYSEVSIISEEADKIENDSEYYFLVDPIDGTRNFVREIPIVHIGIALAKNNEVILCVTYNPILDDMYSAIKGKGSFRNNQRIKVSDRDVETSDLIFDCKNKEKRTRFIKELIKLVYSIGRNSCMHNSLGNVSRGSYDALVSEGSFVWDYCQYLLVDEAGGKVTNWSGDKYDLTKNNLVASNGIIHDQILENLRK